MKIACSSWSFHRSFEEGRIDQKNWIEKCADELELDGVELLDIHFPSTADAYIKEIKKFIIDRGLTISCVSVSNNFGEPRERGRRREVEKVKKWTEIAYKFGSPVLRVFAGWPGLTRRNENRQRRVDKEKLWPKMIECMKESVKYAEDVGVVLGVENHNEKGFVATTDEIFRIKKEVDSDWLMLVLDTGGNVPQPDYAMIEKTIELAPHVHAKFLEIDEKGQDRILDYKKIFGILNRAKYKGFLSIEYEGKEDEFSAIPRVVKFLKDKALRRI